jgi:hypothetical protein
VYESKTITDLLQRKGVVPIEADMTSDSPKTRAIARLREELGSKSIPFMALFPPGDEWSRPFVFRDLLTVSEVERVLERFPDAPGS